MINKSNPQHDAMLQVQQNLLLLAIVTDERVKCITVRHPANQTGVGRQWNY